MFGIFISYLSNILQMRKCLMSLFFIIFCSCACTDEEILYNYTEEGKASYYANLFVGRSTANGEIFSQDSLTAAHRYLPFGTRVKVTNVENGKSIGVLVNDRGPFVRNRVIDLSRRGADSLDFLEQGIAKVRVEAYFENPIVADSLQNLVSRQK